jgi:hypothetical protein
MEITWLLPSYRPTQVLKAAGGSRANTAMWLDLDHMTRGEHIGEIWEYVENPKHEIF